MKKIFTLILTAVLAVSAYADRTVLWTSTTDGGDELSWGKAVGQCSTPTNLKTGDKIIVTVSGKNNSNSWPQVTLETYDSDWGWKDVANQGVWDYSTFPVELTFTLTEDNVTTILSHNLVFVQGCATYVTKIEYEEGATYAEAKDITFDSKTGFIVASQFAGMSLDTKIVLTYNVDGGTSYKGWGPSCIASNIDQNAAGTVKYDKDFGIKNDGDNSVTFTLSDIATVLNTSYDANTGKYGAYWNVWGFTSNGTCTTKRVSIKAYDCTSSKAETFSAKADEATGINTASTSSVSNNVYKVVSNGSVLVVKNGACYKANGVKVNGPIPLPTHK